MVVNAYYEKHNIINLMSCWYMTKGLGPIRTLRAVFNLLNPNPNSMYNLYIMSIFVLCYMQ